MNKYDEGVWYNWTGGPCPVHEQSIVEALWINPEGNYVKVGPKTASTISWTGKHQNRRDDPVSAFRIVKAYRVPREIWVTPRGVIHTSPQFGTMHFREVVE